MRTTEFNNKPTIRLYAKLLLLYIAIVTVIEILHYLVCQIVDINYVFNWKNQIAFLLVYIVFLIVYSLTTLRNKYYIAGDELIVKEYSVFSQSKQQHIPLKSITSVKYVSNVRWIAKHVEIEIKDSTYMLWAVNYKKELYKSLVEYINQKES